MPDHTTDLQKIIDSSASEISKNFFDWVEATLDKTEWDLFETSIEAGDFGTASDLIIWADYDPTVPVTKALQAAGEANSAYISNITGLKNAFDLKDPNALKWIEEHGAELVQQIDEGARRDLREVIYRGYFSGHTPAQQTEYIRSLVGLDERRLKAVDRYAAALQKKGLSNAEINANAKKYSERLLKQRAKTIAVNEASEASGRGTYFSTKDAYNRGVLSQEWEGFRIVTWDERLCPKCAPLAGEARQLPDGVYPSTGETIAKIHVSCRCTEGLRKIGSDRGTTNPNQTQQGATMTKKSRIQKDDARYEFSLDVQALKRKDGVISVPTVPLVEGVYEQWGVRVLRQYSEFSKDSHWLYGIPVVMNHEEVTPEARRVGQLFDIKNNAAERKVNSVTSFYEIDLTQREITLLESGKPLEGSICWMCYIEEESGTWTNPKTGEEKPYDFVEYGPYVFFEYSLVRAGVVGTEDGAGFNLQSQLQSQSPAQRAVKRGKKMSEEIDPGHEPGISEESVKTQISEAVEAAEKRMETKYQARIEELEKEAKARDILEFSDHLKPGHREKAAEHYEALQEDPVKWVRENADKLITAEEAKQLKGQPVVEAAPEKKFDLAEKQRELFKY